MTMSTSQPMPQPTLDLDGDSEEFQAMRRDSVYMAWLREYDSYWEYEYTGTLLAMYAAYLFGKSAR